MTKSERTKLMTEAEAIKGRRQLRFVNEAEIDIMACIDRKRSLTGKPVRVYSNDGFVANSYGYQPRIDYVGKIYVDGKKKLFIGQGDASRSNGKGALVTVNNREYNIG